MKRKIVLFTLSLSFVLVSLFTTASYASIPISVPIEMNNFMYEGFNLNGKMYIPISTLDELRVEGYQNNSVNNINNHIYYRNLINSNAASQIMFSIDALENDMKVNIKISYNGILSVNDTTFKSEGCEVLWFDRELLIPVCILRDKIGLDVRWDTEMKMANITGYMQKDIEKLQGNLEDKIPIGDSTARNAYHNNA